MKDWKLHEDNWVAVQTRQATWIRLQDGHENGPESENIAMVYAPGDASGATIAERVANSDGLALAKAKMMAAAPDMARALLALYEACFPQALSAPEHESLAAARAALKKAGVL